MNVNALRTIRVQYVSDGADKARSDAMAVASAQERMGAAAQSAATVTEQASKRQLSAAAAYEKVRQSVDATAKAEAQYERARKTVERASAQGVIGEAERQATLEAARARYMPGGNDNDPSRRGLSSFQKRDLTYQGLDVFTGVAGGMPLSMIAAQQGPQIFQGLATGEGGLKGGLKALGESALGLITPFTVATAAVVGTAAAFGLAAKSAADDRAKLESATLGLGRGTGATAGQLDQIATRNADPKLSAGTARDITAALASTGQISTTVFDTLIGKATEFAKLTGQDIPAAASMLATAFTDPAKGADDLASKIGGLDDRTRALIASQIEQADKTGAQTTFAAYLKAQIDANTQATTGWAGAWLTISSAADKAWESLKRAAGAATGITPESAEAAVERLNKQIEATNKTRSAIGMDPLGIGSSLIRQRDTQAIIADTEMREARARAAEERANQASRTAGDTSRSLDPLDAQYRDLLTKRNQLQQALDDPLTRSKLADPEQVRTAADAYSRAVDTMVDSNGKLISSAERTRQSDQLRMDALKATTTAEKAAVAERQKAFELAGKALTPLDAGGQVTRAGQLARLEAQSKTGSESDSRDDYDRALRSIEDRTRRQMEDVQTYGMSAEAVARYRTETELLTAAKRAERDITPELTAQIQGYAEKAAAAAQQQQTLRASMREMDDLRGTSRSVLSGFGNDLARGASAADAFTSALSRIESKIIDLAANSLIDALFGKSGTSASGLLGSLFSGSGGLGSLFGFADGGYTGIGGRMEPAGIVHKGEYVIDAASVSRIGVGTLDALRSARGFSEGGWAGAPTPEGGEVASHELAIAA